MLNLSLYAHRHINLTLGFPIASYASRISMSLQPGENFLNDGLLLVVNEDFIS